MRPGYNNIIISVEGFKSAEKPLFSRVSGVLRATLPRRFTTLPRSFTTLPRLFATLPRLLSKNHFRVRPWVQVVGFPFPGATISCFAVILPAVLHFLLAAFPGIAIHSRNCLL